MADAVMVAAEPPVARRDIEAQGRPLSEAVEHQTMGRLLNTYLREVGGAEPADQDLPTAAVAELRSHGRPLCIRLPTTGVRVLTALTRFSAGGHHEFSGPVLIVAADGRSSTVHRTETLAAVLLDELAGRHTDGSAGDGVPQLLADIAASVHNTNQYAAAAIARPLAWLDCAGVSRFLAAEQSLVFGHPFHPAPKSGDRLEVQGASCRPELGAAFRLHYFAVAPSVVMEDRLQGVDDPVPPDAREEARRRLHHSAQDWPLLPVHPWQAATLLSGRALTLLMARDRLIPLGELGTEAVPTSSVRTVYLPASDRFVKLAVDARITNFIRNNPLDHLERSLAASRLLATIPAERRLEVVPELGYRGVSPQAWDDSSDDQDGASNVASLAVLFRRGLGVADGEAPVPVAALLEPALPSNQAPIAELLWSAARARNRHLTAALACDWARAYFEATLVPLLAMYVRHGVSLEAHVQNTMVVLADGWPQRALVRDLEGTSISRRRALAQGFVGRTIRAGSTVLVDEDEAWKRLLYYVVVNHTAHLIATLATYGPAEEWQLWQVARAAIEDAPELAAGAPAIRTLLDGPELPAKANLVSRFEGRSETPTYVAIPNPLAPRGLFG